jgi:hypothetical protein
MKKNDKNPKQPQNVNADKGKDVFACPLSRYNTTERRIGTFVRTSFGIIVR